MNEETDIIIEEAEPEPKLLEIIESQVVIINECHEWSVDLYDDMAADKIRIKSQAFRIIAKAQRKLLSQI
jgi:hypothetical protein